MLIADGHEVVDYSETPAADFVDSATAVAKDLLEHKDSQGFAFDKYGVGSYMAAVKMKGMVVANISDERSAYMTREHNGSRMVTMGPGVVGTEVAKKIAREFLRANPAMAVEIEKKLRAALLVKPGDAEKSVAEAEALDEA